MLTEKQQTVFDWLNDVLQLPGFAAAYKGALQLLNQKSPGYITFVSHAGRDLMNSLVPTVEGIKRQQVQYVQLVEALKSDWKDEWGMEKTKTTVDTENAHLIPYETCKKVKDLLDEHTAGRHRASASESSFFLTFLDYAVQEEIPDKLSQGWQDASRWFRAHAHIREDEFDMEASSEVERHFHTFDNLLYDAATIKFGRMRGSNEILEETNE